VYAENDYTQISTGDITTTVSVHTPLVHTTDLLVDNTATVGGSSSNTSIDTNGNTEVGGYLWSAGDFYLGAARNSGTSKVYMDSTTGNSNFKGTVTGLNIQAVGDTADIYVKQANGNVRSRLKSDGGLDVGVVSNVEDGRIQIRGASAIYSGSGTNPNSVSTIDTEAPAGSLYLSSGNATVWRQGSAGTWVELLDSIDKTSINASITARESSNGTSSVSPWVYIQWPFGGTIYFADFNVNNVTIANNTPTATNLATIDGSVAVPPGASNASAFQATYHGTRGYACVAGTGPGTTGNIQVWLQNTNNSASGSLTFYGVIRVQFLKRG
jgi:hypothetical protein